MRSGTRTPACGEVLMSQPQNDALQLLLDRQAIQDCLARYCRAVDRMDRELLLSVYHPDAAEDHLAVVGGVNEFVEWVFARYNQNLLMSHHAIHNHTCDLVGDIAHCETYWTYRAIYSEPPSASQLGGRYIDKFERRKGRWAIAVRKIVMDWMIEDPAKGPQMFDQSMFGRNDCALASRDGNDPSYWRPLTAANRPGPKQ
jgi:SnoaL-like domain